MFWCTYRTVYTWAITEWVILHIKNKQRTSPNEKKKKKTSLYSNKCWVMSGNRMNCTLLASPYPTFIPSFLPLCIKMWWAKKLKKQLWVWNCIPLRGFQPFCWICILTTFLSNWKSGVRAQSLDLWYGNCLPFMWDFQGVLKSRGSSCLWGEKKKKA